MEHPVERAVRLAGGQTAMAKALKEMGVKVSPQAVQQWIANGSVPADKCPQVEKLLNGQVMAEELNNTVDWAYIRKNRHLPHRGAKNRRHDDPKE